MSRQILLRSVQRGLTLEGTRSDRMWPRLAHCGFGILPWERVFATLSHRYRCAVLLAGGRTTHLFETRKHFLRLPWMTLHRNGRSDKLRSPARKTGQRWRATRAPTRVGVQRRGPRSEERGLSAFSAGTHRCDKRAVRAIRCMSVPCRAVGPLREMEYKRLSFQAMLGPSLIGRSNQ
jgi:hypothetical protein